MFTTQIDAKAFIEGMSLLEQKQFPFAAANATNDAMFDVREEWQRTIGSVFDRPTPLTLNAVLYKKATKQNIVADVFLRNEVASGTPPSRYLERQVTGGARSQKPFEFHLRRAGILAADEFVVPARGFPLDAFGNVPKGIATAILSDLQANPDPLSNSNAASRGKRSRRKAIGKRAVYFLSSPKLEATQGRKSHLPRGIFQRTAFSRGSAVRMVFAIVSQPRYTKRFDAYALAKEIFHRQFPIRFKTRMLEALRTAKLK